MTSLVQQVVTISDFKVGGIYRRLDDATSDPMIVIGGRRDGDIPQDRYFDTGVSINIAYATSNKPEEVSKGEYGAFADMMMDGRFLEEKYEHNGFIKLNERISAIAKVITLDMPVIAQLPHARGPRHLFVHEIALAETKDDLWLRFSRTGKRYRASSTPLCIRHPSRGELHYPLFTSLKPSC